MEATVTAKRLVNEADAMDDQESLDRLQEAVLPLGNRSRALRFDCESEPPRLNPPNAEAYLSRSRKLNRSLVGLRELRIHALTPKAAQVATKIARKHLCS